MDFMMRLYEGKGSSVILSSGDNGSTMPLGRLQIWLGLRWWSVCRGSVLIHVYSREESLSLPQVDVPVYVGLFAQC